MRKCTICQKEYKKIIACPICESITLYSCLGCKSWVSIICSCNLNDPRKKYTEKTKAINKHLAKIEALLTIHDEAFLKDPSNWGFVGNLDSVEFVLNEMIGSIKYFNGKGGR